MDRIQREEDEDIAERDAFAQRIKEKDSKTTRKIMSKSEKKAAEEASKRLNIAGEDAADKDALLSKLREESRKAYLSKRKEDKKMELEALVMDDETLFSKEE